jgi:iron complex outermembrane recepter protein
MFKRTRVSQAAWMLAAGATAIVSFPVVAQTAQRVEITGSAVRRIDAETALHVQTLTKEDIARTGVTSTEALLQSISALSSAGSTNNATGFGTSTYGLSTISLRGLEESRTLVLVNGRRLATFANGSAAVNVNSIPLAAIERVEVLKDGASSIYGSDAMAGVVNFILTKTMSGVELAANIGTPTQKGGGQTQRASIAGGFGAGPFTAVVSASFEKEKALNGADRAFSKSANNLPFYSSGATGQGNIEGAVNPGAYPTDRQPNFGNSPGTGYGNPLADTGRCGDINMFLNPTRTNKISPTLGVGAPFCAFDTGPFVGLTPDRELANLTGNFALKLNQNTELFADLLYSTSETRVTYQAAPLRRDFAAGSNATLEAARVDPSLILFPSNPNYAVAAAYLTKYGYNALVGQPLAITARVFDFGGRQQTDKSTQSRLVTGVRGTLGASTDYELAFMANESDLKGKYTGGVFSVTEYNRIINDPANNWNPWIAGGAQVGALADKLKAAQYIGPSLDGTSKNQGFDGKVSGELFTLPAGQVQYAVGFQTREDRLSRTPAAAPGTGDIAGAGGAAFAIDKKRDTKAAYGEVVVPVLKGLEATISARTDRYSDFGTANTYKLAGAWRPTQEVMVRASYNTGFRAPTLAELFQPQIVGTTEQFDDPATNQTDLQVKGIEGGNPNLKPEKSKASSFGLVFSPLRNVSVGVDFFKIQITDIVQTPGAQEVVSRFRAGDAAFQSLVVLNGNDVDTVRTVTSNLGVANVKGVDLFGTYRQNLGAGRLDVGFNGTYMTQFDQTSPAGALSRKVGTNVEPDGTPVLGADTGGVVLRWKHALSFSYTQGSWTGTLIQNYRTGYRGGNDLNDNPTYVGDESLFDVNVVYRGIKNLSLMLGVKNLLNTKPDTFVPSSNQFQSGYDVTQYDPRGRFVYVGANYKF